MRPQKQAAANYPLCCSARLSNARPPKGEGRASGALQTARVRHVEGMTAFAPKTLDALPSRLPIFPLTSALLMPQGQLPLNIFEPRYLAMVNYALAHERLIGMIQPRQPGQPMGEADVFSVGCAGRISAFGETDDGRYHITLTGVCRFAYKNDQTIAEGFRMADVDFAPFAFDLATESSEGATSAVGDESETGADDQRAELMKSLTGYFTLKGYSADWQKLRNTPTLTLVNSLAMILPFEPLEKQALLEAKHLPERASMLTSLMDMASRSQDEESANDDNGPRSYQ